MNAADSRNKISGLEEVQEKLDKVAAELDKEIANRQKSERVKMNADGDEVTISVAALQDYSQSTHSVSESTVAQTETTVTSSKTSSETTNE